MTGTCESRSRNVQDDFSQMRQPEEASTEKQDVSDDYRLVISEETEISLDSPRSPRSFCARVKALLISNFARRCISGILMAALVSHIIWDSRMYIANTLAVVVMVGAAYEYTWLSWRIVRRFTRALERYTALPSTTCPLSPIVEDKDPDNSGLDLQDDALDSPPLVAGLFQSPSTNFSKYYLAASCVVGLILACVVQTLVYITRKNEPIFHSNSSDYFMKASVMLSTGGFVVGVCCSLVPSLADGFIVLVQTFTFYALTISAQYRSSDSSIPMIAKRLSPLIILSLAFVLCTIIRIARTRSFLPAAGSRRYTKSMISWVLSFRLLLDIVGLMYIVGLNGMIASYTFSPRRGPGRRVFLEFLFVAWFSDTGAYFTGNLLEYLNYTNYHRLAPYLSRKKDWEGTFGGVLFAVVGIFVAVEVFPITSNSNFCEYFSHQWKRGVPERIFFAVLGALVGRVGDLFESGIKRAAGVKHSGRIIPGHGGILDRIDALLFVSVVFSQYMQNARYGFSKNLPEE